MAQKVLEPEDVLVILERVRAGETHRVIAQDFMVAESTVWGISGGRYWNEITGLPRARPLTDRQQRIIAIYAEYWDKKRPVREIADEFGVGKTTVYDIRDGRVGAKLTGHPFPKIRSSKK